MGSHTTEEQRLVCALCGQDHPFEMPTELVDAALAGQLVIFAGAGISTEGRTAYPSTFMESLAAELGDTKPPEVFPEVMTRYEVRFGRRQMLNRLQERLEYIEAFPELLLIVTRFHRELSTAWFLDQVVTTNWDTYFEDYGAATPIVVPDDYAFWDLRGRKVFKLHGSLDNLSTIVATEEDYQRCYRRLRTGTIGSSLRHLLATKRVVFIGYSFGDPDLNAVLAFMRREMRDVLPRSFVVSPHGYRGRDFPADRVIKTDGTFFLRKLKEAAVARGAMYPDEIYERTDRLERRVTSAHLVASAFFIVGQHPALVSTLSYQDGLLHALQRISSLRATGYYSNPTSTDGVLHTYGHAREGAIAQLRYSEAAYVDGYIAGLLTLRLPKAQANRTPLYFLWGSKTPTRSKNEFLTELKEADTLHAGANREGSRELQQLPAGMVFHHPPFLDVEGLMKSRRQSSKRKSC
jgi:hypothetical protein